MAEQELFFIKPTAKVQASSESRGFYDEIVNGKGIFPTKYQLYTFAIMVALLRNATPVPISKTVDICAVDNVDKDNFAVAKGLVAHVCPEINNGSDLLKRMNEYANAGIAILRTDYENNDEDFDPSEYLEKKNKGYGNTFAVALVFYTHGIKSIEAIKLLANS